MSGILKDKTIDDKLLQNPKYDKQNLPFKSVKSLVKTKYFHQSIKF